MLPTLSTRLIGGQEPEETNDARFCFLLNLFYRDPLACGAASAIPQ